MRGADSMFALPQSPLPFSTVGPERSNSTDSSTRALLDTVLSRGFCVNIDVYVAPFWQLPFFDFRSRQSKSHCLHGPCSCVQVVELSKEWGPCPVCMYLHRTHAPLS